MKVEISPYNPAWKDKYKAEAELIRKKCGSHFITIEHAGSTSVEGLAAKPIVDIYIGTKTLADAHSMIPCMQSIGYEYVSEFENGLPFRRYFRKEADGRREFNVHITPASHPFRVNDLVFRDYLTVNPKAKKEYEALKIELGKKNWSLEKESYTKAKTELCLKIKDEAYRYFGKLYEDTESGATYLMHKYASKEACEKAKFSMLHKGNVTAIRTDIFPGFSLNRALGFSVMNTETLNRMEYFFRGKSGKFALQIHPSLMDENTKAFLHSRNYSYANSWVTFYRDSSPIESRGTNLEIKEIGKEYAAKFAVILNDVFSFPHEFDDIAASTVGQKEWITFMAFDGSTPVGSAGICITGETSYLSFANVLPEYRRLGIQGELLSRRIDAARKRGVKWITVDTAENSEENPNPSYWNMLRHGFRLLYHRPNYVKIQ